MEAMKNGIFEISQVKLINAFTFICNFPFRLIVQIQDHN